MVSIYYLSGFNNYYNRTILLPQSNLLADYQDYFLKVDDIENFNPNNNTTTQLIVNYWDAEENINDMVNVDYVLVSSDNIHIDSKWFALDRQRIRGQQWQFTLRRDLVSDNYDALITSPCFIEKATLPADSTLLWNQEDMDFNQIKREEIPLKDKSGCAWIIGYIARGEDTSTTNDYISVDFGLAPEADEEFEDLSTEDLWRYSTNAGNKRVVNPTTLKTRVAYLDSTTYNGIGYFEISNAAPYSINFGTALYSSQTTGYSRIAQIPNSTIQTQITNTWKTTANYITNNINSYISGDDINYNINSTLYYNMLAYNNKIIYDKESEKYYRVSATEYGSSPKFTINVKSGGMFEKMKAGIASAENNGRDFFTGNADMYTFTLLAEGTYIRIELTEIYQESGKVKVHANESNRITCWDSPFDIICAPYADKTIIKSGGNYVQSKETSLAAMMAYAANQGGGDAPALYDLQLLPYCPIPNCINADGDIDSGARQHGVIEDADGNEIGRIFYAAQSQFTIDIDCEIAVPASAIDKKVMNETEMYRLCSPNYNGVFEFSPAKNGGVSKFNVDCSYMPYTPYCHVNPIFGGMYGRDFDDARGLICGGDFSLPMASDAWAAYQRQNKNYQQIFDRQIESMELQNKLQKTQDIIGIATGTLAGAGVGAGAGAKLGSMGGAVSSVGGMGAGAVVGAAIGLAGGLADYQINKQLREDALDMTKDQFGYQLGNIKALPNSLAKTTAYTNNNKIFPFIEKYSAEPVEQEALRNKIKYDGMTVMTIGNIAEYLPYKPEGEEFMYIKGRLIRLLNSETLDYHGLAELAQEIYKGVYI